MQERGVAFYADKLCLSPKYLSALSKSVCGYTVQELVFRAIIRKSIFWLKNTNKSVQEISDDLNFRMLLFSGHFLRSRQGLLLRITGFLLRSKIVSVFNRAF